MDLNAECRYIRKLHTSVHSLPHARVIVFACTFICASVQTSFYMVPLKFWRWKGTALKREVGEQALVDSESRPFWFRSFGEFSAGLSVVKVSGGS